MNDQHTFTNEELTGYLDGEIAPDLAERIRLGIAQDAQVARRVDRLRLSTDQIKDAVDTLLPSAPAPPAILSETTKATPSSTPRLTPARNLIAASLVFLLLGGALGAYLISVRQHSWQEFAAAYHALYVNSTLSHVNRARPVEEAELQRVSAALGKDLKLAVVSDVAQLDYKRAQILGFDGQPIVQLAYLSKIGAPVALCIKRSDHSSDRAMQFRTMHGMSAVSWSKGKYEYLLVGGRDQDALAKAAAKFASRL